ncbi:MAG: usg protein [Alphaproteobacteria bacterium]|jgi:uncharacterized protein Usg|nr:hypothetical protein [Thalassospira sp.]MCE2965066.1 usg protein [Alphaproteobacteria bacterium]
MSKGFLLPEPAQLVTAQILYHLPDYPEILQTFLWQHEDRAPEYPTLRKFIAFWQSQLEGRIHSVTVAGLKERSRHEFNFYAGEYALA